jgi:hypothetical protein
MKGSKGTKWREGEKTFPGQPVHVALAMRCGNVKPQVDNGRESKDPYLAENEMPSTRRRDWDDNVACIGVIGRFSRLESDSGRVARSDIGVPTPRAMSESRYNTDI